jgi:hypothetical protein
MTMKEENLHPRDERLIWEVVYCDDFSCKYLVRLLIGDEGDIGLGMSAPKILVRTKELFKEGGQQWKNRQAIEQCLKGTDSRIVNALHATLLELGHLRGVGNVVCGVGRGWVLELYFG